MLGEAFGIPALQFTDWHTALSTLAGLTKQGETIILLYEISWMACEDKNFPGKLKGIWDTQFKKNNELILILCGSISSWIQDNILNDKGFMGRVSLDLHLEEMPLHDAAKFWPANNMISVNEKFKILSVTGGIPRYLEEIDPNQTAEYNIKQLCFSKGGILVTEFKKIFKDIFGSQADSYRYIVRILLNKSMDTESICAALNVEQSGNFNKKLWVLRESGFLARDYAWNPITSSKKLSKYRIRDNYLRFYLKYIEPKLELIEKSLYQDLNLADINDWHSIMGFQFENLVLNNLPSILKILEIAPSNLISASPYFQHRTQRKQACQIDLLIHTKFSYYICEIKSGKKIGIGVMGEVAEKIKRLKLPSHVSIRPILIYQGELSSQVKAAGYFSQFISFGDLLS